MSYEIVAADGKTVLFTENDYNSMWRTLMDFRDEQHDQNIDGMIVRNTVTKAWDYAWRVARNMQDLRVA